MPWFAFRIQSSMLIISISDPNHDRTGLIICELCGPNDKREELIRRIGVCHKAHEKDGLMSCRASMDVTYKRCALAMDPLKHVIRLVSCLRKHISCKNYLSGGSSQRCTCDTDTTTCFQLSEGRVHLVLSPFAFDGHCCTAGLGCCTAQRN